MSEAPFACLVVADESEEFPDALTYAGLLAKSAGWRLVMLRVIEPADPAPWASITEEMRRQAQTPPRASPSASPPRSGPSAASPSSRCCAKAK